MTRTRTAVIAVAVSLVVMAATVAACAPKTATTTKSGPTALDNLPAARSSLSTLAPDAKLLLVQTAQAVTPTATPIWAFLFGSPSNDKTYLVYATQGRAMGAQAFGTAGLSKDEWSKVPGTDSWKVDSDQAYSKALAVSGAKGPPKAYGMGLITYKPKASTSTIEPFVWSVQFDPGTSGATTSPITVNANTGSAAIKKP